jgi:hypothetical protein
MLTQLFFSPLAPEAIVATLRASTLPSSNNSWQDGFTVSPTQLFQGTIAADSFRLIRLENNKPVRRTSPLPIIGCISASAPNRAGSHLLLRLRPAPLDILTNSVVWGLAVLFFATILVREWPTFRFNSLLYLFLPTCFTAVSYIRIRNEKKAYEQLLSPLLKLTKEP